MAVTKIKPITSTVEKAIDYIISPSKTDEKLLVSSYGCSSDLMAAREFEWTWEAAKQDGLASVKVIARHLIQSFDVGEVSAEQAHEIGQQLADEWLKGKHEYVLATHVDKDHIHNHIIFNAVSFVDHRAYRSNKRTYHELREISDRICAENGLSVIPPTQGKGMDYKEYYEAKQGTSWKQKLRFAIDKNIMLAKDFDDFIRLIQESGYEVRSGKYISFRAEGQERFTRSKTIGDNYTEERIRERISGKRGRILPTERKGISLIIVIKNSIKAQQSKGFEHWAKVNNLKQAAKTLNYLTENNLLQYSDLEDKVAELRSAFSANSESLKAVEDRLREIQPLIKNLDNYRKLKPVWEEYSRIKNKPAFREKHQAELMIFEAARKALREHYGERKWDSLKEMQAKRSRNGHGQGECGLDSLR